ncbi:MAG: hypothetical protein DCF19_07360 [Pseudanabaena frigida]|uniref:Class I SAM-dependent methyltransferase n=1 Tax=Pseudanabaena frigida TaxID=945775 RepID=A0A2W4YH51_9CYAN|nr:MAG: hypothetical protein DCF19_07360 [Pseudanabaena frigida]
MLYTLEYLSSKHSSPYNIVETGCSSWGVSSTLLWDTFVSEFGGTVDSIDINMQNVEHARKAVSENTTIHCSDSVDFLLDYRKPIDLLYLDSFDCDFFRDNGSADHHLKEFKAVENLLKESSLILIDDTPINKHWLDNAMQRKDYDYLSETHVFYGKGNKIYSYLTQQTHSKLLLHTYQCLFEYYP